VHAERAEPPDAYLPDANILSIARSLRLGLPELTGCVPEKIAVPLVALDECLITTSPTHPRRAEYLRLVLGLATIDTATPSIVRLATELVVRYARHGAAIADMLIAAAALEHHMAVVSTNWSDFHFVHGLWLIDARYLTTPSRGPTILFRGQPPAQGPLLPAPPCCKGLVAAGVLPAPVIRRARRS
jgi:predicted nucleic acid-binding protein